MPRALDTATESTLERVPPHLRRYVVTQDYAAYDEVSQAVWRFVTLHAYARLRETAVPEYLSGLSQAGMSVERIPRIEDMDTALSRHGWGAVCVDGFIPPRAFQAFQALGILPIAAEIRTHKHLSYTPAPDIIHEAAGHAPILVNSEYASYLRRIGEVGSKAFTRPEDDDAYRAIYHLSEIKESPSATPEEISAAEAQLARALAKAKTPSEAARLSRLYWWTAEYGLCGTPEEYRLYGAGLLSSLWESHSCHSERVKKLPLGVECLDFGYDITREQPQLFVTPSFAALHDVLEQAEKELAFSLGGTAAVRAAAVSRELATLELDDSLAVSGVLERVHERAGAVAAITLSGRLGVAAHEGTRIRHEKSSESQTGYVLLGSAADGRSLTAWAADLGATQGSGVALVTSLGVELSGDFVSWQVFPRAFELRNVSLRAGGETLPRTDSLWVVLGTDVATAYAGAFSNDFFPPTEFLDRTVPRPSVPPPDLLRLSALYEASLAAWRTYHGPEVLGIFEAVHAELEKRFPEEWLLRWNLLESLVKANQRGPLAEKLERELEKLESFFQEREPIMTGLRRLRELRE